MMRVVILLMLLSGCAAGVNDFASDRLPMFGTEQGRVKTAAMRDADLVFIAEALQLEPTRAAAAQHSAALGWTYLRRGDVETAMKRFNQAWLLDPKTGASYHGFAVVLAEQGAPDSEIVALFKRAIAAGDAEPNASEDFARYRARQP